MLVDNDQENEKQRIGLCKVKEWYKLIDKDKFLVTAVVYCAK